MITGPELEKMKLQLKAMGVLIYADTKRLIEEVESLEAELQERTEKCTT